MKGSRRAPSPRYSITKRQKEILEHVARGCTNQEVATSLRISLNTVRNTLYTIYRKFGVSTRAAAVSVAIREGLIGK